MWQSRRTDGAFCNLKHSFFTQLFFIWEKLLGGSGIQKTKKENYFPVLCTHFSPRQQQQSLQTTKRSIQTADSEGPEVGGQQSIQYSIGFTSLVVP